jgi:hypothetical protein
MVKETSFSRQLQHHHDNEDKSSKAAIGSRGVVGLTPTPGFKLEF